MAGRLYRVSWYPGAVAYPGRAWRVYGEVYQLHDPQAALPWLDAYEGVAPGSQGEFARRELPVRLASGLRLPAWVYLYLRDVSPLTPLPAGRWVPIPP